MAKIYLSSTFKDLAEHRQEVYRVLRQLGHDAISMEDYTATARPPKEKCLADVQACDAYVGIFAWRYGFISPDEAKAITELEYREALDNGKRRKALLEVVGRRHRLASHPRCFSSAAQLAEPHK